MDKDQRDLFDEELDQQPENEGGTQFDGYQDVENDDYNHLMTLLDYLEDAVNSGSTVPFQSGKRKVDIQIVNDIVNDIRGNLPLAVQYAKSIMDDRDNILSSAERTAANKLQNADVRANAAINDAAERGQRMLEDAQSRAEKIIQDAEVRARAMIDQNAIKIAAQNEARAIVNEARVEANERRLEASAYGEELLGNVEQELMRAAELVRKRRQSLGADSE